MNDNAELFWQRVKELIKSQNTTQEWIAKNADVSFSNLKQQIFHKRMPIANEAVAIAKTLHTTVEHLVTGEQDDSEARLNELKKKVLEFAQSVQ